MTSKIPKNHFETTESNLKREWFINNYLKYSPKTSKEEAERLSNIWVNMIILHCRYPPSIEKQIYTFVQSVNTTKIGK